MCAARFVPNMVRSAQGGFSTASLHAYGINSTDELFFVDVDRSFDRTKIQAGACEEPPDVVIAASWPGAERAGF